MSYNVVNNSSQAFDRGHGQYNDRMNRRSQQDIQTKHLIQRDLEANGGVLSDYGNQLVDSLNTLSYDQNGRQYFGEDSMGKQIHPIAQKIMDYDQSVANEANSGEFQSNYAKATYDANPLNPTVPAFDRRVGQAFFDNPLNKAKIAYLQNNDENQAIQTGLADAINKWRMIDPSDVKAKQEAADEINSWRSKNNALNTRLQKVKSQEVANIRNGSTVNIPFGSADRYIQMGAVMPNYQAPNNGKLNDITYDNNNFRPYPIDGQLPVKPLGIK